MPESAYRAVSDPVRLPLLDRVTALALDQDYEYVANRRAGSGGPQQPGRGGLVAAVVALAVLGLLVTTAAMQRTRNAAVDESSRAALIAQVDARREQLSGSQQTIGKLRSETAVMEQKSAEVSSALDATQLRLERVQGRTGFAPVRGPGVRVLVDDSPSGLEAEVVRDTDLALLVDALWGAGAEAIAINGHRLTVLSAIRNSSQAIHVNGQPLAPPYVVDAVGDPRTLQSELVESARGQAFFGLADALHFEREMSNKDSLALPAAPAPGLRWVTSGAPGENESGRSTGKVVP